MNNRGERKNSRLWPPIVTIPVDFIKICSRPKTSVDLTHSLSQTSLGCGLSKRPKPRLRPNEIIIIINNRETKGTIITSSHIVLMNSTWKEGSLTAKWLARRRVNRSTNWAIIRLRKGNQCWRTSLDHSWNSFGFAVFFSLQITVKLISSEWQSASEPCVSAGRGMTKF